MKFLVAAILLLAIASADATCQPGDNCALPDCRCWDDPNAPGEFATRDIPQIIVVSFEYALNSGNVQYYTDLLKNIKNPNGCPAQASFYVTEEYTDFGLVYDMFTSGHEIGVNTITSQIPTGEDEWAGNFSEVISKLERVGIPRDHITGASGPELFFGGDDHVSAMVENDLVYDTTCSTVKYDAGNFLWPYTYDFVNNVPACTTGNAVTKAFPGVWQFLLADLEYDGRKCATPSSCADLIKTSTQAFNLFYDTFNQHYNQKTRPPFLMDIDPLWLTDTQRAEGTKQFLQLVGGTYQDTWIVTTQQALAWIKDPVKANETEDFKPWTC